ncbi:MAG: hypothetical protein ACRD5H_00770 [Nitrososphaerales archaeon]
MKITIEPTVVQDLYPSYPTVTVSIPCDDLGAPEALELVFQALIAWGYPREALINMSTESMSEPKPEPTPD